MDLLKILSGGDLRSIGRVAEVVSWTDTPERFDQLITLLSRSARLIAMRAADAAEKISKERPEWLQPHSAMILWLMGSSGVPIELKWHLALMAGRIHWTEEEAELVSERLAQWMLDAGESKITRVNALEAYCALARKHPFLEPMLKQSLAVLQQQPLPPSILARLRKLGIAFD